MSRKRTRSCLGATHTESKFIRQANAQAIASPSWNPDRSQRGDEHVVLLKRAVNKSALDNRITPAQFKQLVGWV